jgi:hypothetical protein
VNQRRMMDLEVDIATLNQRVAALETQRFGSSDALPGPQPLFRLYAMLCLDGLDPSEEAAVLMRACALLLSPRTVFDLCTLTQDMFAWRPFLLALDMLSEEHDVSDAIGRVEGCARAVMDAQGLHYLDIADVIHSPVGPAANMKTLALSELRKQ